MVRLDWELDRRDGVTFVTATVANARTTPQTVRLESRLGGPTWPPRDDRFTISRWEDDVWIGTIDPGQRHGVGFASPAAPTKPPLEIVDARRAIESERPERETVLASLEEWAPTTDVLAREQ